MNNLSFDPPVTDLLLIDIETVPQYQNYDSLPDNWKPLWIDKISKTVPENISSRKLFAEGWHTRRVWQSNLYKHWLFQL